MSRATAGGESTGRDASQRRFTAGEVYVTRRPLSAEAPEAAARAPRLAPSPPPVPRLDHRAQRRARRHRRRREAVPCQKRAELRYSGLAFGKHVQHQKPLRRRETRGPGRVGVERDGRPIVGQVVVRPAAARRVPAGPRSPGERRLLQRAPGHALEEHRLGRDVRDARELRVDFPQKFVGRRRRDPRNSHVHPAASPRPAEYPRPGPRRCCDRGPGADPSSAARAPSLLIFAALDCLFLFS
mmetsp:Transcript_1273/g.3565  ORF Transcript_1273/g.3565 Transcript_1273/m.3565 type:complete len:241 (+) Transcript_1273:2133-2855(+)